MKEIKTKPLVNVAKSIIAKAPKAVLHKVGASAKNTAEGKAEELVSTNSKEQAVSANSADDMVQGGRIVAEKTAHMAVSTAKKISSNISRAKDAVKTAQDITAETHDLSTDDSLSNINAEPVSIKMRETQPFSIKGRAEPCIKTAPQQVKTHESSAANAKSANSLPISNPKNVKHGSVSKATSANVKTQKEHLQSTKGNALSQKSPIPQTADKLALSEKCGSLQKKRTSQVKTRTAAKTKIAPRSVKTNSTKIRQVGSATKKLKQTQATKKLVQKGAQQAVRVAKITAEKAAQVAKVVAKAVMSAIKACIAAMQSMFAALVAAGGTAFAIILIVCLVALLAGSVLGIFFAAEPTGHGISIQDAMSSLNEEYYKQIEVIQEKVPHDYVEIKSSDGVMGIRWEDVLAVYSAKITGADTPTEVVTIDDAKLNMIRNILVDMNSVTYKTRVDSKEITVPVLDEDGLLTYDEKGEIITEIQIIAETTLVIELQHKTPAQMAGECSFTDKQYKALALLEDTQYATLWAQLLGGLTMNGSGEIISPDTDWTGTDIFAWPLPQSFSITSRFGYRKDPFTGKISYHSGTDIAAPYGTPILAAASGTVTVANATDPWGFSYGYHVKLDNNSGGKETLYAHCSSICVTPGQTVQQGEVIGYVGSTGNSTGNHLHFEVRINGVSVDVLKYFQQ